MHHRCSNCGFIQPECSECSFPSNLPSLPHRLLTTNNAPSEVEADKIHEGLMAGYVRIANLDQMIAALEEMLEKLQRKRKYAADHVHRGTALLSAVRRTPVEVWRQIFSWTIPDKPRRRAVNRCPWVLSYVCSGWRAISLSLPFVWSDIDFRVPLRMLAAHLERSHPYPLTIQLSSSDAAALKILAEASTRWGTADLQMGVPMLPILNRIHGQVPALRQLKFADSTGVGTCRAFEIAPMLIDASISGKASLLLPWVQLTRLQQRIPDFGGLDRLRTAQNLVELSLTNKVPISIWLTRPSADSILVELPCLRKLYIEDGRFLRFAVLPALDDIYVSFQALNLISFIRRSSCQLRRFTSTEEIPAMDIIAILALTPRLGELRLAPISDTRRLLSYLTIPSDTDGIPQCPELHSISVCTTPDDNQSDNSAIVKMMVSRQNRSPTLSLCILDLANTSLGKATPYLLRLGMDVKRLPMTLAKQRLRGWEDEYP